MTSMESYVSQYKQVLGAQIARTDYCTTKDLEEGHSQAKKLILEECRNEALRAGFNPIQSEDDLSAKLQEEYDAEKKALGEQEKKAHAVLAGFMSPMQLSRVKIEKRSAFLRCLPEYVQDMQNAYNKAMMGTPVSGRHKEMFLEFLRIELPQQVRDCYGQLQSDFLGWKKFELEQQMAAANQYHNQEKETLRQQVKEESRAEVSSLQDEVAALKGALQAQPRESDAEQARERDTKRRRQNNVPAPAAARAAGHEQAAELPDTSQKKRKKPDERSEGAGPSSDRLRRAADEDRLAHQHELPVGRGAFKRLTIQEHKECLLKLLPSDGKDVVRNMEERPPELRRKAMWTELLLQKYDALNATDA
ncbi:hypothetical protein DUNSADRAFT_6247 [Dunaliella salina]|uniref:Uncharacterized protein n=1 Tax=Dunaliella salina TaxID=3046 RepID=A0ABQ7GNP5_DUNSA|nr:hypothetical protein DUNSADRAFT_6247 [Dunaliella salina]|eukprot:KAF5836235.1 hypothetical protein DUNSADRAFT_6247 [Dunaliella salina]